MGILRMAKTKVRLTIAGLLKKLEEKGPRGLYRYEESRLREKLRDRCDYLAQLYPKYIEFKNTKIVKCKSCPKFMSDIQQANGSHWIDKGNKGGGQYRCRWKRWNIYTCCEECNAFNKESHHNNLTLHVIGIYGQEQVERWLEEARRTHTTPGIQEIIETIKEYEELLHEAGRDGKYIFLEKNGQK